MSEAKTYTEEEYNTLQGKTEESKVKLDEFRANNVKLMKDMDTLTAKFDGIDVESYNEMVKKQQSMKDKKLIDEGKIEELFAERAKSIQDKHVGEMKKLQDVNDVLSRQMGTLVIDNAVRDSATKSGIVETAVDDILLRSQSVFSLKEGKAVPQDTNGNIMYGEGTSEPMSVQEWVKGQMEVAPHLFKSSNGGGSEHGKNFVGAGSKDMTALEKLQVGFAK